MNGRAHFLAFFWLYRRLRVNQLKRAGLTSSILIVLLAWFIGLLAVGIFVAGLMLGMSSLSEASPLVMLYIWDGLALALLFFWVMGVISDLQRSETLSVDKFLHLPVSLSSALLINYLGSLFSLTLMLFVPAMVGLSLGLAVGRGPAMLLLLPLVAAFLLMLTAITYQFQGWLASLMVNKRRRRTIILLLTMAFVLLAQVPNLLNMLSYSHGSGAQVQQLTEGYARLQRELKEQRITAGQYQQQVAALRRDYDTRAAADSRRRWRQVERAARIGNVLLPPGWLPLGAMAAAEGKFYLAWLATLGMALAGAASLRRSYRTTLRIYTGQFTSGGKRPAAALPVNLETPRAAHLLETKLPRLNEQTTVIALSSFRSLSRAPEAKMLLLSMLLMVVVFGTMAGRASSNMPEAARPMLAFAAMAFILLAMVQLLGNQFGFDRNGFQVFVLSGARRCDILLGKNLAVAPLALVLSLVVVGGLQLTLPMRWVDFLAVPPQMVAMYLQFCLLANWLSILAPVRVPAGSLRGARPGILAILVQLVFVFVLFPLALLPALVPQLVQRLLDWQGWAPGIPICPLLSLAECVAVVYLYRSVLGAQGRLLQAAEQRILGVVRMKAE